MDLSAFAARFTTAAADAINQVDHGVSDTAPVSRPNAQRPEYMNHQCSSPCLLKRHRRRRSLVVDRILLCCAVVSSRMHL
jgi:hypothetical protein